MFELGPESLSPEDLAGKPVTIMPSTRLTFSRRGRATLPVMKLRGVGQERGLLSSRAKDCLAVVEKKEPASTLSAPAGRSQKGGIE